MARSGIPPSEVYRDPRPSRIRRLRAAIPVIRAREALEESESVINTAGLQGVMKETGPGAAKRRAKQDDVKIEPIGYMDWRKQMLALAWPEWFSTEAQQAREQERERERQRAMADSFFGTTPRGHSLTAARLRYVVDEETGHATFIQVQPDAEPAGGEATAEGMAAHHG